MAGLRLRRHRAVAWADRWAAAHAGSPTPMADWLNREGGGRFWTHGDPDWYRSSCTPADLRLAETTSAGVFDLLGSGAVDLGDTPDWRRDLYSAVEWPLVRSSELPLVRGDGSDIRTVWELSRGYHLLALSRAFASTGERRWADTFVRHVDSWLEQNPIGFGPHWLSPMDVGIRAANWILAIHGFAGATVVPVDFWARALSNLFQSGLYLERHLEWHPVYRGNHFVANGVGLVYLGTLFRGTGEGDRWLRRGSAILREEIRRQVGEDGVSFESSLAYHRLVTEMFAFGGELMRLNPPHTGIAEYEARLARMYSFIAAYLPESGEAPMLGDADDGRLHAVSLEGWLEPRRHSLGLPERHWPAAEPGPSAHPAGGFFVLRGGDAHAIIRCGPVGIRGAGSHDHNDQLALELVLGGTRVLADSGTFAYTRDLRARHEFRSTAFHGVVQIDGEEQNPIRADRPWRVLQDRTRARCVEWSIEDEVQRFAGEHRGFAHRGSGAVCRRTVMLHPAQEVCEILDQVSGVGVENVAWRLHFGRGQLRHVTTDGDVHRFTFGDDARILVSVRLPRSLTMTIGSAPASDRYGVAYQRSVLLAVGSTELPLTIETRISVDKR